MSRIFGKTVRPLLVLAAALTLGALALTLGYVSYSERADLLEQGRKTDGTVVGIDVGVRGLKRVMAQYTTLDGRRLVGRDVHSTQWFAANEVGDEVELYYDPFYEGTEPPDILIERGPWIWSTPVLLVLGGFLLLWLGFVLARHERRKGGT